MASPTWHYLENQFDTVTKNSRVRMNAILVDHQTKMVQGAALLPALAPLAVTATVARTNWTTAYNAWVNAKAGYRSATQSVVNLFSTLQVRPSPAGRSKLGQWESKVAAFWEAGHPRYDFLFPQGRVPFTQGARDTIISEIANLGTRLGTTAAEVAAEVAGAGGPETEAGAELTEQAAAMLTLQVAVMAFHAQIAGARTTQTQREGTLDLAAGAIEPLRVAAADALYQNLGLLMGRFHTAETRGQVADYFDLSLIMDPPKPEEEDGSEGEEPPPDGGTGGSA